MPSQTEIQQQITDRILEGLKNGVVPWRKTWRPDKNSGAPANAISARPYSGINPILLDLVAMSRGYSSRFWATYQQWASIGAQVQKRPANVEPGHWGTNIVFYRLIKKTKIENGEEKTESFPVLRTFTVFNVDQVEGADHLRASTDQSPVAFEPGLRRSQRSDHRNWCRHSLRRGSCLLRSPQWGFSPPPRWRLHPVAASRPIHRPSRIHLDQLPRVDSLVRSPIGLDWIVCNGRVDCGNRQ